VYHHFESFLGEVHGGFGREAAVAASIEQTLARLCGKRARGRTSVLLAEPSEVMRRLCGEAFAAPERLLYEPLDLLVISRELPGLNALGLTAAMREADGRNRAIPVILCLGEAPAQRAGELLARERED
jgi:CheY-like chemotaxis protein